MKLYFVSFITKPLKYKICSNSAAVSDNLQVLRISAVFIIGQFNIQSLEMFTCFPNFRLLIGWFFFSRIRSFAYEGFQEAEQKAEWSKSRMGPRAEKYKKVNFYWFNWTNWKNNYYNRQQYQETE